MKALVQVALGATALTALVATFAVAQERMVDINKISDAGVGEKIGTIRVTEAKNGTTFKIDVTGVAAGKHGFHLHEKGDCAAATKDGKIFHFWGTESMMNHVDTVWPYWNLMDFTPEGRPNRDTPPQRFTSEFLEKHYLNKK